MAQQMPEIWKTPTKEEIEALQVGDLAPTCFGTMERITEIFGRGQDLEGLTYVCYFHQWGATSTMSMSLKAGQEIAIA